MMGKSGLNFSPSSEGFSWWWVSFQELQVQKGKILQLGSNGASDQAHQQRNHEWKSTSLYSLFIHSSIQVTLIEYLSCVRHFDGHKRQGDGSDVILFLNEILSYLEKDISKETDIQCKGDQPKLRDNSHWIEYDHAHSLSLTVYPAPPLS